LYVIFFPLRGQFLHYSSRFEQFSRMILEIIYVHIDRE
jgi:hypothetical protein